jgi:nucleoside-diphosphate-sugar epimerase
MFLVNGGMGFVGSYIVRRLIDLKEEVMIFDNPPLGTRAIPPALRGIPLEDYYFCGDMTDHEEVEDAIRKSKATRVIHLASIIFGGAGPYSMCLDNVMGFLNFIEASRDSKVERFVFASSSMVYGLGQQDGTEVDEESPLRPEGIYAATKAYLESIGFEYKKTYGLDFIALRFPCIYGWGRERGGGTWTSHLIEKAIAGGEVTVPNADSKSHFSYVKDTAVACILAATKKPLTSSIFNLDSEKPFRSFTRREFAESVKKSVSGARITIQPGEDPQLTTPTVKKNDTRVFEELDYQPQYPLEKGVADYVTMVRKGQFAW